MIHMYAMPDASVKKFLSLSREIRSAARGMTADEMRDASAEIKKMARINSIATLKANNAPLYQVDENGGAHIPIEGMLVSQASPCSAWFGEAVTEYGYITGASKAADLDPSVSYIVFDVDSGGGYVEGADAAAQAIARVEKRTEARVHNMAASAAYWLASQADAIVAMTPAAQIGSIGVACEVYDDNEALANEGVTHRVFSSTEAPDKRPDLSTDEGRAVVIKELDDLHAVFVSRVAEGRGVTTKKVNADFGRGGILIASDALKAGMIDDVLGKSISRKNKTGVAGDTVDAESGAAKISGGHKMTLEEFKAANPGALDAFAKENFEAGIKAEQTRREALAAFMGINADGDKAVADAIASGKSFTDSFPTVQAAVMRGKSPDANGDNPPDIVAKTPENGAGVSGFVNAEDAVWAKTHGMSAEEFAKYSRKDGE